MNPSPRVEHPVQGDGQPPDVHLLSATAFDGADHLGDLLDGRLGALLLTGAFNPDALAQVVAWLLANPGPAGPHDSAPFPGQTWGDLLVLAAPDRDRYHQRADQLRELFTQAPLDLPSRFRALLTAAGGGVAVDTPEDPNGRLYAPLTVRRLPPGQSVGIHSERSDWPAMVHLHASLQGGSQLSCYAPLALGQGGGQLELYHRPPKGARPDLGGRSDDDVHTQLATFGLTVLRPRVGDLLVFDGGRFNHRVPPATSGERWTAGGFLGRGAGGERWLWS